MARRFGALALVLLMSGCGQAPMAIPAYVAPIAAASNVTNTAANMPYQDPFTRSGPSQATLTPQALTATIDAHKRTVLGLGKLVITVNVRNPAPTAQTGTLT